jgi:hypothetical protein
MGKVETVTEAQLTEKGFEYLGEFGCCTKQHKANQLWAWRDELVIYDPEEERIIWREYNEPRYQENYTNKPNGSLSVGRREHK